MTDPQTLAQQDSNEEGVAAELYGNDPQPTWTIEQIQFEATSRIIAYVDALDADADADLIEELTEVREDIDDDEFATDTQGVHLLALLLGVKVAPQVA